MSKDPFWSKPRTIGELANYYSVSYPTFKRWLSCPTLSGIKPEVGRYFSVKQVKIIINHLGSNEEFDEI